jgi:hypothetical protein
MSALLRNILLFFVFLLFRLGIAKIYQNLSDGAKKYHMVFLVPLPRVDSIVADALSVRLSLLH